MTSHGRLQNLPLLTHQRMVSTKCKRQMSALNNRRHVLAHALVDSRHSAWAVHLPNVRIGLSVRTRHLADFIDGRLVEDDIPAEGRELVEQSSLHEGLGALVNAGAGLAACEGVA